MIDSPAMVIRKLLTGMSGAEVEPPGPGATWPLYVSSMPDGPSVPDDSASLYDTSGVLQARTLEGWNVFRFGIQLRVRSQNYPDGWTKAEAIAGQLAEVLWETVELNSRIYLVQTVSQAGPTIPIGKEKEGSHRELFTVNFLVVVAETGD